MTSQTTTKTQSLSVPASCRRSEIHKVSSDVFSDNTDINHLLQRKWTEHVTCWRLLYCVKLKSMSQSLFLCQSIASIAPHPPPPPAKNVYYTWQRNYDCYFSPGYLIGLSLKYTRWCFCLSHIDVCVGNVLDRMWWYSQVKVIVLKGQFIL